MMSAAASSETIQCNTALPENAFLTKEAKIIKCLPFEKARMSSHRHVIAGPSGAFTCVLISESTLWPFYFFL
jgi:hypothetical protein